MKRTDTIIIGGGQAGLAMSRSLSDRAIDHVVLERGRVGERWRSERWDSLKLLTPRWQSRLPGWSYSGPDPDGFMSRDELITYLEDYARSFTAPVSSGVTVQSVERLGDDYRVTTDRGTWTASNVVVATGQSDQPYIPAMAEGFDRDVRQLTSTGYRNPRQLDAGGVLVVGASSTGVQLAAEIHRSGRPVTLAVGHHTRLPRNYRGRDIMWWLDAMGAMDQSADEVQNYEAARRQHSLQLIGSDDHRSIDLGLLQDSGVQLVGRLESVEGHRIGLANDLAASVAAADTRLFRLMERIDAFSDEQRVGLSERECIRPIRSRTAPTTLNLKAAGVRTVLWAAGYRRSYPWLEVPVLDGNGEIRNRGGVTASPGLYVLGLQFMRRRKSSFIDGVGDDAEALAQHLHERLIRKRLQRRHAVAA